LKRSFKYLAASLIALSCIYASALFVYTVKEPDFGAPVRTEDGSAKIRNDSYGEGDFGAKRKYGRLHQGIDIEGEVGAPVYASKSGFATCISLEGGYGKLIIVNHFGDYQTRYAHLSDFNIRKFQWVNKGNVIGFVGKTGNADYKNMIAHLHYEIRKGGKVLDPMVYLEREQ